MNIVKYAPKTYVDRFFDTDRFFNDSWPWAPVEGQQDFGEGLKVNIVENEDNYTLTAEVPGIKEKGYRPRNQRWPHDSERPL